MLSLSPSPSPLSPTIPIPTKAQFLTKSTPPPLFCLDDPTKTPINTLTPSPTLKGPFWEQHTQTSNPLAQYKKKPLHHPPRPFPCFKPEFPLIRVLFYPLRGFYTKISIIQLRKPFILNVSPHGSPSQSLGRNFKDMEQS